jgi:hypothetical protein
MEYSHSMKNFENEAAVVVRIPGEAKIDGFAGLEEPY